MRDQEEECTRQYQLRVLRHGDDPRVIPVLRELGRRVVHVCACVGVVDTDAVSALVRHRHDKEEAVRCDDDVAVLLYRELELVDLLPTRHLATHATAAVICDLGYGEELGVVVDQK